MRFLILGRDLPLAYFDKNKSTEYSEIACKEPLNNEYEENCKKHSENPLIYNSETEMDNLSVDEETVDGVKPKLRGPVV